MYIFKFFFIILIDSDQNNVCNLSKCDMIGLNTLSNLIISLCCY